MRNIKFVTLPILLMIVLSMIGFAYAHWQQVLYLNGTIKTGSLTIGFTDCTCVEKYLNPSPPPKYLDGEWEGKDVGKVECKFEDYVQDPHTLKEGFKTIVATITNAYPSYMVHITFVVENLGTIPVHFVEITAEDPTGELKWDEAQMCFWKDFDGDGIKDDPDEIIINVDVVNLMCIQLDPCHDTKAEIDLHFKQPLEQCHTYTIKFTIKAVQWNEA